MFIFIHDKKLNRCIHYASNPGDNLLDFFNDKCHREFYTDQDYLKMGGRADDLPQVTFNDKNDT